MSALMLGRIPAPDERDNRFPMSSALPTVVERRWRYWGSGWWGDQGMRPHCVGYAWAHWLEDGPHTQPGIAPVVDPSHLYHQAQLIDEWPGEDYDGTSVRAGAKVLQAAGYVASYLWAWDIDTLVDAVLSVGPVVVGTWWYRSMFVPDEEGFLRIDGPRDGGHAYLINGANRDRAIVRVKNSWGKGWARNGHAYLGFDDLARLIDEDGEACLASELTP